MGDGWVNYLKLDFELDKIETNPGMMQKIGRDETIVIVVLNVEIGRMKGKINICLPGNLLVSIFHILEEEPEEKNDEEITEQIFSGIKSTPMEIKAELGESMLMLKDLFNLQVGDVINLNKPKDSDVFLYIEGKPWFKGELGKNNKNMAIKINEICEKK
jgi:flagellar motor switch protein FliM